ncbi:glycoside hydrolase superfamily [Crepidotus variabilis]|uniref:alpha-amylase n=1 Tax=Crepidotus variabilis TaxID=179855 RepID=A0A9P6EFP6_9AGAR|nr:glycoside hydrolase superfamily [Crepidotus variabilis]
MVGLWRAQLLLSLLQVFLLELTTAADADAWRSRRIYQLLTDRFGRSVTTSACDISARAYCTGSWLGIVDHLDYVRDMGFDAIWISPIVSNIESTTAYGQAFHGYWANDINQLNQHFGSADDLNRLVKEVHDRKMYIMVDVVVNHFVANSTNTSTTVDFSSITTFPSANFFHAEHFIQSTDYTQNQTAVEQGWLGDDKVALADLDTENPDVVNTMNAWIGNITKTYSIDGVRIDTVKHVRKDFWPAFAKASGVYTIGEVLDNRVDYVADYTKVIDGVLDYPTYFAATQAFGSTTGNLSVLVDTVTQSQNSYQHGLFYSGSFIENHDQPRFPNSTNNTALIRNAIAWSFTNDALPILYYGQEQGFSGGNDPWNREPLWPTGYPLGEERPLVTHIRSLNQARKIAGIFSNSSFYSTASTFIPQSSSGLIALSKPPMLSVFTNIGSNFTGKVPPKWTIPSSAKLFKGKKQVVDVLTCAYFKTDGSGGLIAYADNGFPRVFLPAEALDVAENTDLCKKPAYSAAMSVAQTKGTSVLIIAVLVLVAQAMA